MPVFTLTASYLGHHDLWSRDYNPPEIDPHLPMRGDGITRRTESLRHALSKKGFSMVSPNPSPIGGVRDVYKQRLKKAVSLWLISFLAGCCMLALTSQSGCSAGGAEPSIAVNIEPAKVAVTTFLEAIKRGDERSAMAMLTDVARAKTQELGLSVAPPVKDTATYRVGDCETVGGTDDIVHVATTWTDTDAEGFTTTDNVIWVCRLDPEGWRVVGMAMRIFPDMPPLLLDFEDPEDMLAKQRLVAEEITRRAKLAMQQQTTQNPATRTASGDSGTVVE